MNIRIVMVIIILALGGTGYFSMAYMHKKMELLEDVAHELEAVSSLNLSLHEAVSCLNNYLVQGGPGERERFKDASEEVWRSFDRVAEHEGRLDVSLENARLLYGNIERLAEDLLKKEAPLNNKDAVLIMLEIQQTADWITQFYIEVHELKGREKLEMAVGEGKSARRWLGWMQITGTISALIAGFIFLKNKQ